MRVDGLKQRGRTRSSRSSTVGHVQGVQDYRGWKTLQGVQDSTCRHLHADKTLRRTEKRRGAERRANVKQKDQLRERDSKRQGRSLGRQDEREKRRRLELGFELFVFTVDLDLISIQLRHAVNAKSGACYRRRKSAHLSLKQHAKGITEKLCVSAIVFCKLSSIFYCFLFSE